MRWELVSPRHVPPVAGEPVVELRAWLTVAVRAAIAVPEWGVDDEVWVHWAAPLDGDGAPAEPLRARGPVGRAMLPGEPPEWRAAAPEWRFDESAARQAIGDALNAWRPDVHRQPELGVVSSPDEDRTAFRKRFLAPLGRMLQTSGGGAAAARLATGIESRRLAPEELAVRHIAFGVVWLPPAVEPAVPQRDSMLSGAPRGAR